MVAGKRDEADKYLKECIKKVSENEKVNKLKWLVERSKAKYALGDKIDKCVEEINHEIYHGKYEESDCEQAFASVLSMMLL